MGKWGAPGKRRVVERQSNLQKNLALLDDRAQKFL